MLLRTMRTKERLNGERMEENRSQTVGLGDEMTWGRIR